MDLQYILCIANSSYAVKTPKDKVTCDTYYCNFYKKLKIWTCFPQNGRFRDQTGGREITSQNGSLPFNERVRTYVSSCIIYFYVLSLFLLIYLLYFFEIKIYQLFKIIIEIEYRQTRFLSKRKREIRDLKYKTQKNLLHK